MVMHMGTLIKYERIPQVSKAMDGPLPSTGLQMYFLLLMSCFQVHVATSHVSPGQQLTVNCRTLKTYKYTMCQCNGPHFVLFAEPEGMCLPKTVRNRCYRHFKPSNILIHFMFWNIEMIPPSQCVHNYC